MKKYNAKKCSILPLVLTYKWYDAIDKGGKREDYRLNSDRNQKLICNWIDRAKMDGIPKIVAFQRAYSKPGMFWLARADWRMRSTPVSHPEWGEDQYAGKPRWALQLLERVEVVGYKTKSGKKKVRNHGH